jgi:large subunit ribosomal protein L20
MVRIKRGVQAKSRHKKILKMAKGYRGRSKNVFRIAIQKVEKGLEYAYRDRRTKKRNFRGMWIQRINAGARKHGMSYSQFIKGIKKAEIDIDRKILADIALNNPITFKYIVEKIRNTKEKTT